MAYYPRLRDLREDHDLTQRQLAALLGMAQPQYSRYEQGLRDIPTRLSGAVLQSPTVFFVSLVSGIVPFPARLPRSKMR